MLEKKANINFRAFVRDYKMIFVLAALVIIGPLVSDSFGQRDNVLNTLRQAALIGIVSVGVSFVIISGTFDLSAGSAISVTGVLAIYLQPAIGVGMAVVVALAAGVLIGLVNGSIIALIKGGAGDAFMITFGMQSLLQAIALIVSKGHILPGSESALYNWLGAGFIGPIPVPVVLFIIIAVVMNLFLTRTRTGRSVYYVGANVDAARLSGISVEKMRVIVYVLAGFFAAFIAIIITGRIRSATATIGENYEMDALTAIVIGGISIGGGKGNIWNTVIGSFIIALLTNILFLLGVNTQNQMIAKGAVLILAVVIDQTRLFTGTAKKKRKAVEPS